MKLIWQKIMPDYEHTTLIWREGTRGGERYLENYCNWNKREDDLFANYKKTGKGNVIGWIYMLDKKIRFLFIIANSPAPKRTLIEDGKDNYDERITRKKSAKKNKNRTSSKVWNVFHKDISSLLGNAQQTILQCNSP